MKWYTNESYFLRICRKVIFSESIISSENSKKNSRNKGAKWVDHLFPTLCAYSLGYEREFTHSEHFCWHYVILTVCIIGSLFRFFRLQACGIFGDDHSTEVNLNMNIHWLVDLGITNSNNKDLWVLGNYFVRWFTSSHH